MNQLSQIISIDNAAVTRHIDILEREGLVKRESDANDRRKNIIRITDKGIIERTRPRQSPACKQYDQRRIHRSRDRAFKTY